MGEDHGGNRRREGRLQLKAPESHHRNLPAHRRGKDRPVQVRLRLRRGLHQDLHGLLQGRRDLPRRGAVRRPCRAPCEDQGCRRHFQPCRRGEVHYAGRVPPGHLPHCQDREGIGGQRLLRQHRTIASASLSRLFAPLLQFEKREIHTVFLRFPNFELGQKSCLRLLAELCGAALNPRPPTL